MTATQPQYQAFVTFEADPEYTFRDPVHSGDDSEFSYTISVYRGIPVGQTIDNAIDDGKRYIYLGEAYSKLFMTQHDFSVRLADQTLQNDFNILQGGGQITFPLWTAKGASAAMPRNFVADYSSGMTFAAWSKKQKSVWGNISQVAGEAVPPTPYNVLARFIEPATFTGFELVFTPSENQALLTKDKLTEYATQVINGEGGPKYPFRVLTYQEADNDATLMLLSSSFFGFYHTWITAANYQAVCTAVGTDPLARPWPADANKAAEIDTLLGTSGDTGTGYTTSSLISAHKFRAARGMRDTVPSQKSVMAGLSATDVAKKLWAANTLNPNKRPADAEWLHRSAFHYGGVGANADLNSSQTRLNLVFGTGEANTDMIRGENAVTDIVNLCVDSNGGTLITQNILNGNVSRRNSDGTFVSTAIPAWVEQQRAQNIKSLWWLCMDLRYRFTFADKDLNIDLSGTTDYDPFSRYIPFRVEARLDQLILEEFVAQAQDASGQAAKKKQKPNPPTNNAVVPTPMKSLVALSLPSLNTSLSSPNLLANVAVAATPVQVPMKLPVNPLPLPTTSNPGTHVLPPFMANHHTSVQAMQQWRSVSTGTQTLHVNGAIVRSPVVRPHGAKKPLPIRPKKAPLKSTLALASSPTPVATPAASQLSAITQAVLESTDPPSTGFTLEGEIDLFGIDSLKAQFYSWTGPLPPDVDPPTGTPVYDKAVIDGDFKLSSVLSALQGTPFDDITFRNVTLMHQNTNFDPSKANGWHIDADIMLDSGCGKLWDVLRTVLNVQEPAIHLHAGLGFNQDWGKSLAISSITLDGSFPGIQVPICQGLTLTSVGVELQGIRRMEMLPKPHNVLDYGFGVFGSFNLDVPGSVTPLELDYRISELGGFVQLSADLKGDIWNAPLGIKGLQLSNVSFTADVGLSEPMQTFEFEVSATFQYKMTTAIFMGSYSAAGDFAMSAVINDFSIMSVFEIFESLTGTYLALPDVDITIGSASVTVASSTGLVIQLQDVQIDGHIAANASLNIGPSGVIIRGDVSSSESITFGDVELKKAFIEIDLVQGAEGSGVMIGGEVAFEGFTFDALVHLYKGDAGSLQWTVFASLTASNDSLALSKLVPELHGTFLDLALTQVVFAAASQDDPVVSSQTVIPYKLHKGVQIAATLSPISSLDSLMRSSAPTNGLVLDAGWSKDTGFSLDVIMPTASVVHLGRGIVTDPFKLRIQGGTTPSLLLIAGVTIPVEPDGNNLDFQLSLGLDPLGASATAQMHGYWTNPLGLGANVRIGPDVALSIDIIFAQFLTTGTPSGFGIVGGLAIGKASAQIAMEINENPSRELISGKVQALDVNDIISFANTVTGLSIPQPTNFLDFEDVELYICPAGTTIGTIVYPQGFSFQASMVIFGKHADIACSVGSNSITIKGGVDNFSLGPLAVSGVNDPHPTVDVEISPSRQHIDIDGQVTFFDSGYAVSVQVDVLPSPAFSFMTSLKFTDLLVFTLNATLVGAVSFSTLDNADFVFYAAMEQHILQYVEDQITTQFDAARAAAHDGFVKAQNDLKSAQDTVDQRIDAAQKTLDDAQKAWDAKRQQVTTNSQNAINNYLSQIDQLQKKIDNAQQTYNTAMQSAQSALQQAQNNRASALSNAQQSLEQAKANAQSAIDSASRSVQAAEDKMNREFGNAVNAIQDAQNKVNGLQSQINDVKSQIDHYNSLPWYDPRRAAVVGLGTELAGLEVAKGTADGVLSAAKAVVQSAGYVADQAGIQAAQLALQAAKNAAPVTISAAQGVLDGVDKSTAAAVSAAEQTVKATQTGADFIALQGAQQALSAYKSANEAVYNAAVAALNDLTSLAEYVAYQAATAALATAKQATSTLDGLKNALNVAQQAEELGVEIGEWVTQHALGLVDIRKIELSGSLRGMIGETGGVSKPFTAHVEYVLAGQAGTFDGQLDLRETAAFITAIFEKMWNEVKSIV